MKKCVVIGSINMDMVTCMDVFPLPGETRMGTSFTTSPGGKGANQAVALGRLGVDVRMAGTVGNDAFGDVYRKHFQENHVGCQDVAISPTLSTGTATITVNAHGENCIVVVAGANDACDMAWLDHVLASTSDADIFLLQLEIRPEVTFEAIRRLKSAGKTVVLDPAPAIPIPDSVLCCVDYITPNETELKCITPDLPESASTQQRVAYLQKQGVGCVVHKAGASGAYITAGTEIRHVPGFRVKAVDTTAAGDTFNAGLAAGLAMEKDLFEAVRIANAAGALAVTKLGAQSGMPTMEQVRQLMEEQP